MTISNLQNDLPLFVLVSCLLSFISIFFVLKKQNNKTKLKLDLFEYRFDIYNSALKLIASITIKGKLDLDDEVNALLLGIYQARWLLNNDIVHYLEELYDRAIDLQILDSLLKSSIKTESLEERNNNLHRQEELKEWFSQQYETLNKKFSPFLKLDS